MFLQLFIPTWKFFDQLGTVSKLYYRDLSPDGAMIWLPVFEKPTRNFLNLFYNPEGNLYLACVALVDRLVIDVGSKEPLPAEYVEKLESYLLVQNMVRVFLREKFQTQFLRVQFKIQVESEHASPDDFLISKELVL